MRHKVSFGISAAASLFLVGLYFVRHRPHLALPGTEPSPSSVLTEASQYPLCREIEGKFTAMAAKLGCAADLILERAVCEQAFTTRAACEKPLRAAWTCLGSAGEKAFRCAPSGAVELSHDVCVTEVDALTGCLE